MFSVISGVLLRPLAFPSPVRRSQMLLLACSAAMALVLAAIGMYGVVSYTVAQRRNELGIRIALGADSRAVMALVLLGGIKPVIVGMAAGIGAAVPVQLEMEKAFSQ